jgi:hypothetical protein
MERVSELMVRDVISALAGGRKNCVEKRKRKCPMEMVFKDCLCLLFFFFFLLYVFVLGSCTSGISLGDFPLSFVEEDEGKDLCLFKLATEDFILFKAATGGAALGACGEYNSSATSFWN